MEERKGDIHRKDCDTGSRLFLLITLLEGASAVHINMVHFGWFAVGGLYANTKDIGRVPGVESGLVYGTWALVLSVTTNYIRSDCLDRRNVYAIYELGLQYFGSVNLSNFLFMG